LNVLQNRSSSTGALVWTAVERILLVPAMMPLSTSQLFVLYVLGWAALLGVPDACEALSEPVRGAASLSVLEPGPATSSLHRDPAPGTMNDDGPLMAGHHPCRPRFVHLSPTGDSGSVRLTWQTEKRGCSSTVRYKRTSWLESLDGPRLSLRCTFFSCTATGYEAVFDAETDCYSMEDVRLGWEPKMILYRHTVVLDRLAAGQIEYQYEFESERHRGERNSTEMRTFKSPPRDSPDARLEFIVFGDMGAPTAEKCPGSLGTIRALTAEAMLGDIDIIFHDGDISYADGTAAVWDDFQAAIEPISSRVPYAVTVGNHDYGWLPGIGKKKHHHSRAVDASGLEKPYLPEWGNFSPDSNGECGWPLVQRFVMPESRHHSPSRAPFWYSVRMGPAHFVIISGEHDLSNGSEQRAWLEGELDAVDLSKTPWVIVLIHRPLYVVLPHKSNRIVGEHLAEMLEDTFIERKVSLVLSGHIHSASRSCPLVKGKCEHNGITYITMGSGGKEISAIDDPEDQPDWLVSAQLTFGFGRFQVFNRTLMTFEYVESESGQGRVIDTVVVNSRA